MEQLALDLEGLPEVGKVVVLVNAKPTPEFADCTLVNTETAGGIRSAWVKNDVLGWYVRHLERRGFRIETR
ncbi:MAG: hypothetical protein GX785_03365 [Armatimonadetes bacterium]|nr:hypothetical protein [Armatimonadota bacterium]